MNVKTSFSEIKIYSLYFWVLLLCSLLNEAHDYAFITGTINVVVFLVGILLVIGKFSLTEANVYGDNERRRLSFSKDKELIVLTVFWVLNLASVFLNHQYNTGTNLQTLMYMFLQFYLIYDHFNKNNIEFKKRLFKQLGAVLVTFTMVVNILSLIMFVLGIRIQVSQIYVIGFDNTSNRLWGFFNPNAGAALAIISIAFSLYFIAYANRKTAKIVNVISIVIQYLYIVLAHSRSALVGLAVFAFFVLLAVLYNLQIKIMRKNIGKIEKRDQNKLSLNKAKVFVISAVLSMFLSVLIVSSTFVIRPFIMRIPVDTDNAIEKIDNNLNVKIKNKKSGIFIESDDLKKISPERSTAAQLVDPNRGRILFWLETIKLLNDKPLLGVSYSGVVEGVSAAVKSPTAKAEIQAGGIHSSLISIVGASGILGLIVFLIYFFLQNLSIVRMFYLQYSMKHSLDLSMIIIYALVIAFIIIDLVETRLLYSLNFMSIFFWFFMGILQDQSKESLKEEFIFNSGL